MKVMRSIVYMLVLLLGTSISINAQTDDTVTVNAAIRGHLTFVLDGTDAGGSLVAGDYTSAENCDLGTLDAAGSAVTGGDALVTGITGYAVDAAGLDLGAGGVYSPTCVGSFYHFFETVGVPNQFAHDDAALGIYILSSRVTSYSLDVTAVVAGDASVAVGQLKWKDNSTALGDNGYGDYTDFSAGSTNVASGGAGNIRQEFYHDYGLLVEFDDAVGNYTWTVTYTLTTI